MSAAERVDRWMKQSDDIEARVLVALDTLPADAVRAVAKLYVENVGYLGEHLPHEREHAKRFACTGNSYHGCSYGIAHQQGCKAIGGDGNLVGSAYENARSCAADCDASAPDEPWCHCSGFDCPDCAMVDNLLGLLEAHNA